MKKLLLIIAIFGYSIISNAKQIDVQKATAVAQNFIEKTASLRAFSNAQLSLTKTESTIVQNKRLNTFYAFSINTGGFVIIAADDIITPILGYSTESSFNANDIPASIQSYFNQLNEGIATAITNNLVSVDVTNEWNYYTDVNSTRAGVSGNNTTMAVGPLVTTKWNQTKDYQKFCPSYTGCVATAFAQILKYYNYPEVGMGYKSYSNNYYGTQAANFGATTYKWTDMPNQLSSSTPVSNIDAVATLMYHAGVSIDMDYTPTQSSAYSYKVVDALKKTFGYSSSATIISRSSYTLQGWTNKIKTELDASRVVMHTGYCPNPAAGHAFVVDGYDANGLYHINWGWGGYLDGYFQLSNLTTGSYTWNQNQQLVIGITPASPFGYKLTLDATTTFPSTATVGNNITVTAKVKNTGTSSASGSIMAALFNDRNELVYTVQTLSNRTIAAGAAATYTFTNYNLSVLPGTYKLGIYFARNGVSTSWQLVGAGSYTNPKSIIAKSKSKLSVNSAFTCTPSTTMFQSDSCLINLSIKNTSTTSFSGSIKAGIYSNSGVLKKDIQIYLTNTIAAGASMMYQFKVSSLSNLSPGSYYIAIQSKATGTSNYEFLNAQSGYNETQRIIIKKNGAKSFVSEDDNADEPKAEELKISIYPNPVSSELTISSNSTNEKVIVLMDLNGRIVKQITSTNEATVRVPVSELTNGIYIVSIIENGTQKTYKIIKQ